MSVYERQPYAGSLVFTAFSGSHQDAIAKGISWREEKDYKHWTVPYLPIDPKDVGRKYDSDVTRINSQSGKGGVSYILKQNFGIQLPEKMKEEMGYISKSISDANHKELIPEWIYEVFQSEYMGTGQTFKVDECHFKQQEGIIAEVTIEYNKQQKVLKGKGNGRLDAVSNALKQYFSANYEISCYEEYALEKASSSKAISYVGITCHDELSRGAAVLIPHFKEDGSVSNGSLRIKKQLWKEYFWSKSYCLITTQF